MLVFISRQKFLRLRLQLNLIKVKPALAEGGQRGGGGWDGRWSAWYSYSKSDFIIIFNFWFTAHFERVPLFPPSRIQSTSCCSLFLSFFAAHEQLIMSLCACVRLKMPARPTPAASSPASHCPLPALHRAVLAWGPRQHSAATTQKPTTQTHTHIHQMMLIFTHSNNNNKKWSSSQHQIVATLR